MPLHGPLAAEHCCSAQRPSAGVAAWRQLRRRRRLPCCSLHLALAGHLPHRKAPPGARLWRLRQRALQRQVRSCACACSWAACRRGAAQPGLAAAAIAGLHRKPRLLLYAGPRLYTTTVFDYFLTPCAEYREATQAWNTTEGLLYSEQQAGEGGSDQRLQQLQVAPLKQPYLLLPEQLPAPPQQALPAAHCPQVPALSSCLAPSAGTRCMEASCSSMPSQQGARRRPKGLLRSFRHHALTSAPDGRGCRQRSAPPW